MANTTNLDLEKPLGTDHALIAKINSNMDKIDDYAGKVNDSLAGVQDGLAIVAVGDTHAAITSGQFVYVKEHNTLPEGLYTASTNIAANGALSTSNLTADSKGGLNALSDQITQLSNTGNIRSSFFGVGKTADGTVTIYKVGKLCILQLNVKFVDGESFSHGNAIGQVPSGYTPSYGFTFDLNAVLSNRAPGYFEIGSNGNIYCWADPSMDGATFYNASIPYFTN